MVILYSYVSSPEAIKTHRSAQISAFLHDRLWGESSMVFHPHWEVTNPKVSPGQSETYHAIDKHIAETCSVNTNLEYQSGITMIRYSYAHI